MISQALQIPANTQNCTSRRPQIRLIGYARVSTNEQATTARNMELRAASCAERLLREIDACDTLVVVRLDHVASSVTHLEEIEGLTERSVHLQSLRDTFLVAPARSALEIPAMSSSYGCVRAITS